MAHITPPDHELELLSAYLDGELSDRERASLEQRLTQDPNLRAALDDLRAAVAMLRDLPPLKAPRNFTLDPAIYSRSMPWWKQVFTLGSMLQFAGAVGTVAAVMIIASAFWLSGNFAENQAGAPGTAFDQADDSDAAALLPTHMAGPVGNPTMTAFAANQATAIANANTDAAAFDATLHAQSAMYASTEIYGTMTADAIVQAFSEASGVEGETVAGAAAPSGSPLPDDPAFMQMQPPPTAGDAEPGIAAAETMLDNGAPSPGEADGALREASMTATQAPTASMTRTPLPTGTVTQEPTLAAPAPVQQHEEEAPEQRDTDDTIWLAGLGAVLLVVSLVVFGMGLRRARRV